MDYQEGICCFRSRLWGKVCLSILEIQNK